jgi:hypothetical protein
MFTRHQAKIFLALIGILILVTGCDPNKAYLGRCIGGPQCQGGTGKNPNFKMDFSQDGSEERSYPIEWCNHPECQKSVPNPNYDPEYNGFRQLGNWFQSLFSDPGSETYKLGGGPAEVKNHPYLYETRDLTPFEINHLKSFNKNDDLEKLKEQNSKLDADLKSETATLKSQLDTLKKTAEERKAALLAETEQLTHPAELDKVKRLNQSIEDSKNQHNAGTNEVLNKIPPSDPSLNAGSEKDKPHYLSAPNTPLGKKIYDADRYANSISNIVERFPEGSREKVIGTELVRVGREAIVKADQEYAAGDIDSGNSTLKIAYTVLDVAASITPGVGLAKDIYESVTGKNAITGEKLETFDRSMAIIGALTGGIGSKVGKGIKLLRELALATEVAEDAIKTQKAFEVAESAIGAGIKTEKEATEIVEAVGRTGVPKEDVLKEVTDTTKDAIEAMGPKKFAEVIKAPKGTRPRPEDYLPKEYIESHLAKFNEGASKFIRKDQLHKYGPAHADGTAFVLPKMETEALLAKAKGNKRVLEDALGFERGYLDNNELVRVDIAKPKEMGLRVPSGNEAGANPQWLPGGKLPNGNSEAVIDLGSAPAGSWSSRPLEF